jgi:hypothetical protein
MSSPNELLSELEVHFRHDRHQEQRREKDDAAKLVTAVEQWTETKRVIEDDDLTAELVAETVPYDKEKWKFFREEILKVMDGQHADYLKVGQMFIQSAIDYAEDYVKEATE